MNKPCAVSTLNRIVFWEPMLSPHKLQFFQSLATLLPGVAVVCIADQDLSEGRRRLGWLIDSEAQVEVVIAPAKSLLNAHFTGPLSQQMHIFSGIRHVPIISIGLKLARAHGIRPVIMSEPRVMEGLSGYLRLLQSWATESWLRRHCEAVLAIGANGPKWFRRARYREQCIFPFAYFVNLHAPVAALERGLIGHEGPMRIGFLGRFVREKGVLDLLGACRRLEFPYHVALMGEGQAYSEMQASIEKHGLAARLHDPVPMTEVTAFLSGIDVLVACSTTEDDGWGVVVSEALLTGASVVVTPQVGASILAANDPSLGSIVDANCPSAIASALRAYASNIDSLRAGRFARAEWASHRISAPAGAEYFRKIICHLRCGAPRPTPFYTQTEAFSPMACSSVELDS